MRLQEDIDELEKWSSKWLLGLNLEKCKIMHVGKSNPNFNYQMLSNGVKFSLEKSVLEKDVGVMISNDLKWREQVNSSVTRANAVLGKVSKSVTFRSKELIKSLYCTFVRPLLEFAVPVWCPYQSTDIDKLERVQRRATKLIPELRHLSYEERLIELYLTTLETRRKRGDIIQFYKLKNGIEDINWFKQRIPVSSLTTSGPASSIRGHKHRLEKENVKNCLQRFNFFTNRIVNIFVILPKETVEAKSVNSLNWICIKAKLDLHFNKSA